MVSPAARFRETTTSDTNLESSLTPCCQRDGWNRTEDAGKWSVQVLDLMAAWCEVPHSFPYWLFVNSSRWDWEGAVKSTDMLALGGPPFKNSSLFAAADTSSCRFPSSLDTLANEFRNYTGLPNCCDWVEQHYWDHLLGHTTVLSATGEGRRGEKSTKGLLSIFQQLWVKLGRWNTCREIAQEQL